MADFSHIVVARHLDCGHIIATLIVDELFIQTLLTFGTSESEHIYTL